MRFLQEKNQVQCIPGPEETHRWTSDESARVAKSEEAFDLMPPGMGIENQNFSEQNNMPLSLAGRTDVSNEETSAKALVEGYARLDMKPTDDMYTGENTDLFYSDVGGFCERNNVCDRS